MVALFFLCFTAVAEVTAPELSGLVTVRARVSEDLRTIEGTFHAPDIKTVEWTDLLGRLPVPRSDRLQHRTFPGRAEAGKLWFEADPGVERPRSFHTIIPRRFGASGVVPGRGLFLNGLWHPHPVSKGRIAIVDWDVTLELPPGATGVLNGVVSKGTLSFRGRSDRLSLAVLYGARVQTFELNETAELTLVDAGPMREKRDQRTVAIALQGIDHAHSSSLTVVETPMRRRLVRTGPSTVFMSDRSLRVTHPEWGLHVPSLQQGLQRAALKIRDPWIRDLVGTTLLASQRSMQPVRKVAKWRAWMPRVDSFLYDGRVPFATESLKEGWSSERIADDPLELVEAVSPASTAAWKLSAMHGPGSLQTFATAMASGASFADAIALAGLTDSDVGVWRTPPPVTDISVDAERAGGLWDITLRRDGPSTAPKEPIAFQINGELRQWTTATGPDSLVLTTTERPDRIRLDPSAVVLQDNRQNDEWPRPVSVTLTGSLSEINVNRIRPTASAYMLARHQRASHWMHALVAHTNPIEVGSIYYSLGYDFGRKLDRRNRIWRAWAGPSVALLDPRFRATPNGHTAVDIRSGIRVDTRDNWPFSRRGFRASVGVSSGFVPIEQSRWQSGSSEAIVLVDLPGPMVWANKLKLGATTSSVTHRQFSLGGSNGIQGLPIDAHFGNIRSFGTTELRFSPIRDASIPMWLWWVTTIQVSSSMELAQVDDQRAAGWTVGLGAVSDIWGQTPYFTGIWVAKSLDYGGFSGPYPTQFYLRLGQNF